MGKSSAEAGTSSARPGDAVPGRRPSARGEQRRQAILEVALQLFAARGYDGVSLRTIAEAAQNIPLLGIFDTLNALRRAVTWGRLR